MPRNKPHVFKRLYVRHHCEDCGSRCFPFDKYEGETISPVEGIRRPNIMLATYNHRNVEQRRAWCWSCGGWRIMNRVKENEILQMYLERNGVEFRSRRNLRLGMKREEKSA